MQVSNMLFSSALNPYQNTYFPVIFLDKQMKIIFANNACQNLFSGLLDLSNAYFSDVFGKFFGVEGLRAIRKTLEGENGYFWGGKVSIKSPKKASLFIKAYIFPAELNSKAEPSEFIVMFDDISEEHRKHTRSTFWSLLEASKLKDNDTGNHIVRVNCYAKKLTEKLRTCQKIGYNTIDPDFIESIGFLASMHDVGKIGTPDDILNKKGALLTWEWTLMREHTKNGAYILSTYPNPMAKEIALSHHERWDGSGYPYQLAGEMIPLAARIVAIADVYDALRMERSYKPAFDHATAVQKIVNAKGSHFDPFLVDVFTLIHRDFNALFEENQDKSKHKLQSL